MDLKSIISRSYAKPKLPVDTFKKRQLSKVCYTSIKRKIIYLSNDTEFMTDKAQTKLGLAIINLSFPSLDCNCHIHYNALHEYNTSFLITMLLSIHRR